MGFIAFHSRAAFDLPNKFQEFKYFCTLGNDRLPCSVGNASVCSGNSDVTEERALILKDEKHTSGGHTISCFLQSLLNWLF